jgi:CPA2 family monovalent cation:H+ antiporter-2
VLAVVFLIVFGKSIAAFVIVMLRGFPVRTALTVSASLAQIGEFSFILVALGVSLGMLPPEGRDLVLAGAILSITLNPLVFASIDPILGWIKARPALAARLERASADDLVNADAVESGMKNHAIIVGYGRVGEVIGDQLKAQGLDFVIIEEDRRRLEELRRLGLHAIYGDAAAAGVLEAAGVADARILIVAIPPGVLKRRIIELAREANPAIQTAVRTHRASELAYLKSQGVGFAIMGTREVALGLLGFALTSMGYTEKKAQAVVQEARLSGDGAAFDRELLEATPELREHKEADGAA